jgi:hypothetical protein
MRVQQFCTYSLLVSGSGAAQAAGGKKGKATPASMVKPGSRIKQLIDWLAPGRDDDGGSSLIVFDECHKAKNLINSAGEPTKTALAVVAIQEALPDARVLYCSATGASEPTQAPVPVSFRPASRSPSAAADYSAAPSRARRASETGRWR